MNALLAVCGRYRDNMARRSIQAVLTHRATTARQEESNSARVDRASPPCDMILPLSEAGGVRSFIYVYRARGIMRHEAGRGMQCILTDTERAARRGEVEGEE